MNVMDDFAEIDELLARGAYKKVVHETDRRLKDADFSRTNGVFERFSFLNGDAYTWFTKKYPERQIVWVKNLASLIFAKAYSLNELGRNSQAVEVLKTAVELDPVSPRIKFELCSNLIKIKSYDEALEALTGVPECVMRPHDAAVYYAKRAYLASQNGEMQLSRDFALYSIAFERNNAAEKELEYVSSFLEETVVNDDSAIRKAAERLQKCNESFKLSESAVTALVYLRDLYRIGGDEEKWQRYDEYLKVFESVRLSTEV